MQGQSDVSPLKESYLPRLLQVILPTGGYLVAIIEAYFDESGTDSGSPFLCVAGYIFEKGKAIAFDAEWQNMRGKYGLEYFRMSECSKNIGAFEHLSPDQCDAVAREAIALAKKYTEHGIAVSLARDAFHLQPKDDLFHTPYAFMCWQVFYGVRNWADRHGHLNKIAYYFEQGADGQRDFQSATARIFENQDMQREFRLGPVAFQKKKEAMPLQCADLLAWHWFTHNKRLLEGKGKRKDFKSLIELGNIDVHSLSRVEFEQWLNLMQNQQPDHGKATPY